METDLTAYIARQAAITALIGTRFEPVLNVQRSVMPAVSYQVISGPTDYSQDGPGLTSWRVQLTVTDPTYAAMEALAKLLRSLRWLVNAGRVWTAAMCRSSRTLWTVWRRRPARQGSICGAWTW